MNNAQTAVLAAHNMRAGTPNVKGFVPIRDAEGALLFVVSQDVLSDDLNTLLLYAVHRWAQGHHAGVAQAQLHMRQCLGLES